MLRAAVLTIGTMIQEIGNKVERKVRGASSETHKGAQEGVCHPRKAVEALDPAKRWETRESAG